MATRQTRRTSDNGMMSFIQISREQATQFLDLVEKYRMGEITRRTLRTSLDRLSESEQEPFWELFLTRFDEAGEGFPRTH